MLVWINTRQRYKYFCLDSANGNKENCVKDFHDTSKMIYIPMRPFFQQTMHFLRKKIMALYFTPTP
jgi:hypothetical protein